MSKIFKTFSHHWSAIVSSHIFVDDELKRLMMIPQDRLDDIYGFETYWFCNVLVDDMPIDDRQVIINYYDEKGGDTNNVDVQDKSISFDIYVSEEHMYGADEDDYMVPRTKLIYERLKQILCSKYGVEGLKFRCTNDYSLSCKLIGYNRYHVTMQYLKIYG